MVRSSEIIMHVPDSVSEQSRRTHVGSYKPALLMNEIASVHTVVVGDVVHVF